jgi:hypothetical protein
VDGETWTPSGDSLLSLLLPGGWLAASHEGERSSEFSSIREELSSQTEPAARGVRILCTYRGSHTIDGHTTQDIELKIKGALMLELPECSYFAWNKAQPTQCPRRGDVHGRNECKLDGKGWLSWDPAARRPDSYELQTQCQVGSRIWGSTHVRSDPLPDEDVIVTQLSCTMRTKLVTRPR